MLISTIFLICKMFGVHASDIAFIAGAAIGRFFIVQYFLPLPSPCDFCLVSVDVEFTLAWTVSTAVCSSFHRSGEIPIRAQK